MQSIQETREWGEWALKYQKEGDKGKVEINGLENKQYKNSWN